MHFSSFFDLLTLITKSLLGLRVPLKIEEKGYKSVFFCGQIAKMVGLAMMEKHS
jgi:hypothetical protein